MNFYKTKIMYLSSVGGHLDQLLKIANYINIENSIFIVNGRTDFDDIMIGKTIRITHAERNWKQIINFIEALFYIGKYRPQFLLSTGASPAIPFSLVAKIIGTKIIFIESLSRVYSPSLSGKIMYYFSDYFYIQWSGLKKFFPKSLFYGNLFE